MVKYNFKKQVDENLRLLITGTARTGKSWLRDYTVGELIKNNIRDYFVVVDDKISNAENLYKEYGFKIEEINRKNVMHNIDFKKFIVEQERVYFIVKDLSKDEMEYFINKMARIVYRIKNSVLIVDEGHYLLNRKLDLTEFKRALRGGAKDGVDFILVSHRIVDFDPDIVALCTPIITFIISSFIKIIIN